MKDSKSAWTMGLLLGCALQVGCEQVKDACDIDCSEQGIAHGNASITGVKSLDDFFGAVIRFDQKAEQVSAGIDAELVALAADFGVDAAALRTSFGGDVAASLRAQFDANLEAGVNVRAEPPRCDLDARAELSASAECQVEAGCDVTVDPGTATLECKGSCYVDANARAECGATAELACTFRGPQVACDAECKGICTAQFSTAARCDGTCQGTCTVSPLADGKCDGLCQGTCAIEAKAGAECHGTCSGECTARGPMANCAGAAEVRCEAKANASVSCTGKCEGDFEPPMAMARCEAAATCNAQAKADASVEVQCSEPALDVDYELRAGIDARAAARMELGMRQLEVRLPRILARLQQAELLMNASAELAAAAGGAAEGTIRAFGSGELGAVAALRVADCAPAQFEAVPALIAASTAELRASIDAAGRLNTAVGL